MCNFRTALKYSRHTECFVLDPLLPGYPETKFLRRPVAPYHLFLLLSTVLHCFRYLRAERVAEKDFSRKQTPRLKWNRVTENKWLLFPDTSKVGFLCILKQILLSSLLGTESRERESRRKRRKSSVHSWPEVKHPEKEPTKSVNFVRIDLLLSNVGFFVRFMKGNWEWRWECSWSVRSLSKRGPSGRHSKRLWPTVAQDLIQNSAGFSGSWSKTSLFYWIKMG